MLCEYCSSEHDGLYASGRFCNILCSSRFSAKSKKPDTSRKISNAVKNFNQKKHIECFTSLEKIETDILQKIAFESKTFKEMAEKLISLNLVQFSTIKYI